MSSMRGFLQHLWISLKLNFRNPMAVVMGYLLPIIFLLVFGAFLNTPRYKMSDQIAQLLTISILGGACFGLPIAFVSERERGVWRRYKLTPMPTRNFVISLLCAAVMAVIAWRLWAYADQLRGWGVTEYLKLPQAPFAYIMGGFAGITAVIELYRAFRPVPPSDITASDTA